MEKKTYWPYVISAFAGLFGLGLLDNIRGPFYSDILLAMNLSESQGSFFYSIVSTVMIPATLLSPYLLRWLAPIGVLRLGLIVMGLGFMMYYGATEYWQLIAIGVIFSLGFSIVTVIQNFVVQVGAAPKMRQRLFSGLHAFYALASLMVPLFAIMLRPLGWRLAFAVCALFPIFVALITFFVKEIKISPEEISQGRPLPRKLIYEGILVSLGLACYLSAEISVGTRLVHLLRKDFGYDPSYASWHLFAFFLALFLGRVGFARYHPSISAARLLMISALGSALAYLGGLYINPWLFFIVGLLMAPCFPLFLEYLSESFGPYWDKVMALSMGIASAGLMIMHNVVGVLTDMWGVQTALLVGPLAQILFFIVIFSHKKVRAQITAKPI